MGTPLLLMAVLLLTLHSRLTTATWCVARSDASREALQTALDYACSAGADCAPLQPSGLCFLPNTIQAHASYAFNSYYMRRFMAPGSCDFSGTATFAKTDPSYGSCVYPPSPSTAGATTTPITTPGVSGNVPSPPLIGGGLTPVANETTTVPTLDTPSPASKASSSQITLFILFSFILELITILSAA
ncbi:putative X8 domain-containing protein [Helianthus annuus]|uniref:Putative X8 domain-containing protein n=1 Tax=Helianthus annuus TaxID=4232 RepID=A0A251UAG7_HELAN|nr:putative carbohydrate-binding X8 domain-containing protein, plant [Helianthus annuus]KAJ0638743.1 putative carbohydrate-binding X8 domain-containing protein, plant [Helianthus annuus]KAJ0906572.1 putative X8 domain-containing protein [Helianthus annuus]